MKQRKR